MKIRFRLLLLTASVFLSYFTVTAQNIEEGKKIFTANCTACHAVNSQVLGPALKDVDKRRDQAWLLKWIKNAPAVLKSGDAYAVGLAAKYPSTVMTAFGQLTDGDIKNILAYIKDEGGKAPVIAGIDPKNPVEPPANKDSFYSNTTLIVLLALLLVLILVAMLLGRVKHTLEEQHWAKNPTHRPENVDYSFWNDTFWPWVRGWNKTVAVIAFLMIFFLLFAIPYSFNYANTEIGVQKGYSPAQPINFSHKIHAGEYKINCQYCHYSVEKSKQASIPSASTCMNCHLHIQAKEKNGGNISPEIQKIYTAVGFDPATGKYDKTKEQPIRWIRIHNLPDHAVFNHSVHVKIGKVACQKCHGEVQEMAVVYQRNSLQMGWCINCHRESKVDLASNPYYEKLHERLKKEGKYVNAEGKVDIKVAQNGGLECSKCHY